MLEILALVFLTRKIGNLAQTKDLKPGIWKLYTVLAWFLGEFLGAIIGFVLFPHEIMVILLLAYGGAIGSYFLIKTIVTRKPDAGLEMEINQFGHDSSN